MNAPANLSYSKEHEWIRVENGSATVGITDFAQQELGDVVYVELPEVGASYTANDAFGSLESVKAVSEAYMPVSGEITEVNQALLDAPEKINESPYQEGWMIKARLHNPSELEGLLSAEEYTRYVTEESSS